MPHGQFKSVYAVSSEDPAHPASNLLKIQSGKKWRTKTAGEKSAFIILQFENPQKITAIDIGNEHSSFASVAVGRKGCSSDDFKEILITSSFMTPIESKNSTNTNRVRCFASNALDGSIAAEKWDLVKVVCTQPFNRHVPYGLSFVTIHVADDAKPSSSASSIKTTSLVPEKFLNQQAGPSRIGHLQLRRDSTDSEPDNSNTLFSRWKQSQNGALSTASAIRAASSPSALKNHSESSKPKFEISSSSSGRDRDEDMPKIRDRNRDDLLYEKDDDEPNERLERRISDDQNRLQKEQDVAKNKNKKHNRTMTKIEESPNENKAKKSKVDSIPEGSKKQNDPTPSKKRPSSSPSSSHNIPAKKLKPDKPIEYRPFNKLLQGVVLVISGIQNPDRATLRQKTIDLGARYKPDWDDSCTHLICAFQNTPKYNQVRGKGKIVTRHWIEKCHSLKKRLPWRRYALDDREAEKRESEDEIHDLSLKPPDSNNRRLDSPVEKSPSPPPPQRKDSIDDTLTHYDLNDDGPAQNFPISSGSDTEEEIEKTKKKTLNEKIKKETTPAGEKRTKFLNVYEESTEEDGSMKAPTGNAKNCEFFAGLKFFLSASVPATELIKVEQYIREFKGDMVEKMIDSDFVITKEPIEKKDDYKGEVVSPLWILECYDMECRIPTRRYLV